MIDTTKLTYSNPVRKTSIRKTRSFTISLPGKILLLPLQEGQHMRRVRVMPWRRYRFVL